MAFYPASVAISPVTMDTDSVILILFVLLRQRGSTQNGRVEGGIRILFYQKQKQLIFQGASTNTVTHSCSFLKSWFLLSTPVRMGELEATCEARTRLHPLIRVRVAGAAASAEKPRQPSPQPLPPALPGVSRGVHRPAERYNPSSVSWVGPVLIKIAI